MYLSHISTLEEAAAYLSEKTGDSWTPKSVLDFALAKPKQSSRKPAPIAFAAMPIGTVFGRYEFTSPGGMVRKGSARWQLVPLYPIHAAQLIAAGNTFAGLVESPDDDYADGEHYAFIEPLESEHEITLDMVRLKRAAIESIAEQYNAAASSGTPESDEPKAPTPEASKGERTTVSWQEQARQIADELFNHDTNAKCRDCLIRRNGRNEIVGGYAYRVMEEMQKREIHGPRGRFDNAGTISKEALQGDKWWARKPK